jgi:hypothetical protein
VDSLIRSNPTGSRALWLLWLRTLFSVEIGEGPFRVLCRRSTYVVHNCIYGGCKLTSEGLAYDPRNSSFWMLVSGNCFTIRGQHIIGGV